MEITNASSGSGIRSKPNNQAVRQLRLRAILWGTLFAVLALAVVLAVLFRAQAIQADKLRSAEFSSQERRAQIARALSAHQDIETGQRGYVLTGQDQFLDPVRDGEEQLEALIPAMREDFAGDEDQLARLANFERVSAEKRAFSERVIALARQGDTTTARALIASGQGKRLMDQLRRFNQSMLNSEMQKLSSTQRKVDGAISRQRNGSIIAFTAMLLLLMCAGLAVHRAFEGRSRALADLDDASRRRQAILDGAMDAIVIVNPSGSIESVNRSAVGMFGFSESELRSRDVGLLFAADMPIGAAAKMLRDLELEAGEAGEVRKIIGRRKGGTTFPTDVALTLVELAEGFRYVAVIRDATERDRIDRMKSEFVSTVSHELRTPLTSIAGSLGLLAGGAGGHLESKAARLVNIARNNAERLVRLINDILDVEKLEAGRMPFNNQRLDVRNLIDAALDENAGYADRFGVKLHFERPVDEVMALVDPDRMAQLLGNLLSNAIKFSPEHGVVTVELLPGEENHRLKVVDQGPGIPDEFRPRMFQKFAQADSSDSRAKGGTGLGLSIVREIVNRMGGTIEFESRTGEGTSVQIAIPADSEPAQTVALREVLLLCGAAAPWVEEILGSTDRKIEHAATIEEICQAIDSGRVLAIVLDMGMADGMPARIIRMARSRKDGAEIPIFALGSGLESEVGMDEPAVLMDWLHKPGEVDLIQQRIDAVMLDREGDLPQVLHLDDDPDILRVVSSALEGRARVVSIDNLAAARSALSGTKFDLVILDLTLREGYGTELLKDLPQGASAPPIIVFSAEDDDGRNAAAFDAFLTKSRTPIRKLVERVEDLASPGSGRM